MLVQVVLSSNTYKLNICKKKTMQYKKMTYVLQFNIFKITNQSNTYFAFLCVLITQILAHVFLIMLKIHLAH